MRHDAQALFVIVVIDVCSTILIFLQDIIPLLDIIAKSNDMDSNEQTHSKLHCDRVGEQMKHARSRWIRTCCLERGR